MIGLQEIRSMDPKPHLVRSGCALRSVVPFDLSPVSKCSFAVIACIYVPVCALYTRAILSMLPVMKKTPSGDQARS